MKTSITCLIAALIILSMNGTTRAQHYTDWEGFEFSPVAGPGFSGEAVFYEVQKDYTISLPEYFLDPTKLPDGAQETLDFNRTWATQNLMPANWDFLGLEYGGILTVKNGYRWDGPSYPCFLGIEIVDHHLRSSLIHDALYDLMRMGYLEADHWDVQDNRLDPHGVDNAGDYNRRLTDMMIYMIGVEDGQTVGDGDLTDFGDALTDYLILRTVGRSATHDDDKLVEWKYHSSELTAYASDGRVELEWKRPDASSKDPDFWEHFYPFEAYTVLRNGQPLITIQVDAPYPFPPVFATSWVDNTVVNGTAYSYQVIPVQSNTNQYDWTNTDVVTPVELSGTALVLDGIDDYVEANTVSNDFAFEMFPNPFPIALTMEAWIFPGAQTGNNAVMAFNTFAGDNQNMVVYHGEDQKFYHFAPGSETVLSTIPSAPGQWYHVAVTLDVVGNGVLYVDGIQRATFTTAVRPSHGSRFSIGQEWDNGTTSGHFKGMIDEVRIWKVARSHVQIQDAMNISMRGDETGLVGLWHFDDPNDLFVLAAPPFSDTARKAYGGTVNACDGILHGFDPSDVPFVASGAMGQIITAVDDEEENDDGTDPLPNEFALGQNHPNPFNPDTKIDFALPRRSFVQLEIFDTLGRRIRTLMSETLSAGRHTIVWDGRDNDGVTAATGVYFYRLQTDQDTQTKKMLLLK